MGRHSGIVMHISSLPGAYGIGTFGNEAMEFVNFLEKAGQKYWQILPLAQTGYGDSPYQSFSAFAGNPYFIDFDILESKGLLNRDDYCNVNFGDNKNEVDYGRLFVEKMNVLRKAYENSKNIINSEEVASFRREKSLWIEDYALFMAIKYDKGLTPLSTWEEQLRTRNEDTLNYYREKLQDDINYWIFIQYEFFNQWNVLKKYANSKGIEIIGDIPIYVAADSADLWANPNAFLLDEKGNPTVVAGCPPDAFSATGQLWGNPIYDWEYMKNSNYYWWVDRVRESLTMYDVIRIDHFRGFEAYWQIPYGEDTAINGQWIKGPGISLFNAIKESLGDINVIAEDLGYLTNDVLEMRDETNFPGMKVLQFAFDSREESDYLPHNYIRNCVAYTGTHDNDTFRGWFDVTAPKEDVEFAKKYLALNEQEGYNWGFIRGVWSCVADTSIALMQDFLDLGNETRMNFPSTLGVNWKWRVDKEGLSDELAEKIYDITKTYGRLNDYEKRSN